MAFPTRRTTTDPLVRSLLDKYKFNLLSVPRSGADVYDIYIGKGRDFLPPDRLDTFFAPRPDFPEPKRGEAFKLPEVAFSGQLDLSVGAKIAAKLFNAFDMSVNEAGLTAAFEASRASKAKLRFVSVTRDHVKPLGVHAKFNAAPILPEMLQILNGKLIYLVIGVVRAKGLEFVLSDDSRKEVVVKADGELATAAEVEANGKVSMRNTKSGSLVFQGRDPIAFGVELVELKVHAISGQFVVGNLPPAVNIRNSKLVEKKFIGGEDGPIFVAVDSPGSS